MQALSSLEVLSWFKKHQLSHFWRGCAFRAVLIFDMPVNSTRLQHWCMLNSLCWDSDHHRLLTQHSPSGIADSSAAVVVVVVAAVAGILSGLPST